MRKIPLPCSLILISGLLAGCAGLPFGLAGPATPDASETAAPQAQPTLSPGAFEVIASPACLAASLPVLQTEPHTGDLMDWEPGSPRLAYLAPSSRTNWHLGDVVILDLAAEEPAPVPVIANAAGQLHWLPDGRLILETFRPIDTVYSVVTVVPDGSQQLDLFPGNAAHTDLYSSPKAVLQDDDGTLTILSVCGLDCIEVYTLSAAGLEPQAGQWTALEGRSAWLPAVNTRELPPGIDYPAMYAANWNVDGTQAVYYDGQDNLWVLDQARQELFALGYPDMPLETDWSDNGRYLAVRGDGRVNIYQMDCEGQ